MTATATKWLARLIVGYLAVCALAYLAALAVEGLWGPTARDSVAFGVPLVAGFWFMWKAADVDALDARLRETR